MRANVASSPAYSARPSISSSSVSYTHLDVYKRQELRTPLTSVLANLELLAESLENNDQGDAARSALRSSQRMRRLVADLLLLARTDAARVVSREPCDLAQIVVEAAGELGPVSSCLLYTSRCV